MNISIRDSIVHQCDVHALLKDRATLTLNVARTGANPNAEIVITSRPTPIQAKAFDLLGLTPNCSQ